MTGTVPHEDIRLIATDLDGTFLGAGGRLVARNVEAVRAAAAQGITIVVATGRPYRWTDVIDPLADIHPLLLSSNGAVIADPATGRVLHHWPIDPADGLAFGAALVRRVPDAGFAVEFASHGWGADARYVAAHPEGEPDLVAPLADLMAFDDVVKLLALSILNERFGMTEKDFLRAEIEFVPAVKATDVGLDRSLVGAYGQDDKVCAYTALTAEMKAKSPEYTTVTILADKEEIGSVGNTGLNSDFTLHYIEGLCKAGNVDVRKVLKHSLCLSADVNAAYDPTFASVFEEKNSCYLNKGVVLTKYTGARGKSGSNDASAETMAKVIQIMDEAGVYWQIGELGAVDVGGGGTVALFVAGMDVDVVDMGVPILSMHAPFELASKLDIYNTYLAFAAFCR